MQCTMFTLSGHRCRRTAVAGRSLCRFHSGMASASLARPSAPGSAPVDTVLGMPAPQIAAAAEQPPLVTVIMGAAAAVAAGEVTSDDELGLLVAQELQALHGSHDDLEYLIEAGCAPDWTRGYFRALLPA